MTVFSSAIRSIVAFLLVSLCFMQAHADIREAGHLLYDFQISNNKVKVYNLETDSAEADILLPADTDSADIHNDLLYLAFDRTLRVRDINSGEMTFVLNTTDNILDIRISDDYFWLILEESSNYRRIEVYSAANSTLIDDESFHYSDFKSLSLLSNDILQIHRGIYYYRYKIKGSYLSRDHSGDYDAQSWLLNDTHLIFPDGKVSVRSDATKNFSNNAAISASMVKDAAYLNDYYLTADASNIFAHNVEGVRKLQSPIVHPFVGMTPHGNDLYLYNTAPLKRVAKISMDDFSAISPMPISGQRNYDFSAQAFDSKNEILYVSNYDHIQALDFKTGQQSSLPVYATISDLAYSSAQQTLYIAHDNNSVSYIDLTLETPANIPVIQHSSETESMMPMADQMMIGRKSGYAHLIDNNKQVLNTSFSSEPKERQHYFSQLDQYLIIASNSWGYLNQLNDDNSLSRLHSTYNKSFTSPFYPLDEQNQFVTSKGRIFEVSMNGFTALGTLANDVSDAAHFNGQLITLKSTGSQNWLQQWQSNYDKEIELSLPHGDGYRLHRSDSAIYVVSHSNGNLRYMKFTSTGFADTDADGISDFDDNCPNISNADQSNYDNDNSGDACDQDADNDGLNNQIEVIAGLNPLNDVDVLEDNDNDGISNGLEALTGSNLNDDQSKPAYMPEFDINFANNNWQMFLQQSNTDSGNWYMGTTLYPWQEANNQNNNVFLHPALNKNYQRIGLKLAIGSTNAWLSFSLQKARNSGDYCPVYVLANGRILFPSYDTNYTSNTIVYDYRVPIFADTSDIEFGIRSRHENWSTDGCSDSVELLAVKLSYAQHPDDYDNDGFNNAIDNCPNRSNSSQADSNDDGIGDTCQLEYGPDNDDDGIYDQVDNCPRNYNPEQTNTDNDSEGDVCDSDDDNDGFSDYQEISLGMNPLVYDDPYGDPDGDGIDTRTEILDGSDPLKKDFKELINIADYFNGIGYGHWSIDFGPDNTVDFYLERQSSTRFWYGTSAYKMFFNTSSGLALKAISLKDEKSGDFYTTQFEPAIRILSVQEAFGRPIYQETFTTVSGIDPLTGEAFAFDTMYTAKTILYPQLNENDELIQNEIGLSITVTDEWDGYTMFFLEERWSKDEGLLGAGGGEFGFLPAVPIEVTKDWDSGESGGSQSLLFIALLSIFAWRMRINRYSNP